MKKRVGRPPGRVKVSLYYKKIILESLAESYTEGMRFTDLKKYIPSPRILTDYLKKMWGNGFIEKTIKPDYPRGIYRITAKGAEELLKIRMAITIPKGLSESQLRELIKKTLHTNITLNLIDGKTQTLQGFVLLPYEEIRKVIEERWKDEEFMMETCRMLHSILHFRAIAPTGRAFAKCIEGTTVFFMRPPSGVMERLKELIKSDPRIPNLDAAICYVMESWYKTPELIKNEFPNVYQAVKEGKFTLREAHLKALKLLDKNLLESK